MPPEAAFRMAKLYVDKKIKIKAPAAKVWEALTSRAATDVWSLEFGGDGPLLHIESDWQLGDAVLWKDENGTTAVEGNVTALVPGKMVRFTAFDARSPRPDRVDEEDDITLDVAESDGTTTLHVRQGDFGALEGGAKLRAASAQIWDRVLPKIRTLAEAESEGAAP